VLGITQHPFILIRRDNMPKLKNEKFANQLLITAHGEVKFDENGIATEPEEALTLLADLDGFEVIEEVEEPKEVEKVEEPKEEEKKAEEPTEEAPKKKRKKKED
jgi:hypothetical protein